MMCSMCPSIIVSNKKGPGYGWICVCRQANCAHMLNCYHCGRNRYMLETAGQLANGRPVATMEPDPRD